MELRTYQIDLDTIASIDQTRYPFDPEVHQIEVEHLAHSIVELQGLLRIPVVEEIDVEAYKLIAGHFDYFAYLKARELDPDLPDRIRAFVINKKNPLPILQQLEAIDRLETVSGSSERSEPGEASLTTLELQNVLRSELQTLRQELLGKIETVKTEVHGLKRSKADELAAVQDFQSLKDYLDTQFAAIKRTSRRSGTKKSEPKLVGLIAEDIEHFESKDFWQMLNVVQANSKEYAYAFLKMQATGVYSQDYRLVTVLDKVAARNQSNSTAITEKELEGLGKGHISAKGLKDIIEKWPKAVVEPTAQDSKTTPEPEIKTPPASKSTATVSDSPVPDSAQDEAAINSYAEFKQVALEIYDRLNRDFNMDDLVPIYQVRREIGDRTSRSQFDQWILQLQRDGLINLQSGDMPDLNPEIVADSVKTELGNIRYYIQQN